MRVSHLLLAVLLALSASSCREKSAGPPGVDPCADAIDAIPQPFDVNGGIVIYQRGSEIVSWNHEQDGESFGEIVVPVDTQTEPCEIRVIAPRLPRDIVTNRAVAVTLDTICITWQVRLSSAIVMIHPQSEPWTFKVHGLVPGRTTARILFRSADGESLCTSGAFDIVVEDPAEAALASQDFTVVLNGIREVLGLGGDLVASCGAVVADPGYLSARVGEITDGHYSFRRLDPGDCDAAALPDSTHHLNFEFMDDDVCAVINHPEHPGVKTGFSLLGLTPGSTHVRIRCYEGDDLILRTPWIPVEVSAP